MTKRIRKINNKTKFFKTMYKIMTKKIRKINNKTKYFKILIIYRIYKI